MDDPAVGISRILLIGLRLCCAALHRANLRCASSGQGEQRLRHLAPQTSALFAAAVVFFRPFPIFLVEGHKFPRKHKLYKESVMNKQEGQEKQKKLRLHRETIRSLARDELNKIVGGLSYEGNSGSVIAGCTIDSMSACVEP